MPHASSKRRSRRSICRSPQDAHRLGRRNRNAPGLARIAEACGIRMITVHGRTRCQLYPAARLQLFARSRRRFRSGHRQWRHHSLDEADQALTQSAPMA